MSALYVNFDVYLENLAIFGVFTLREIQLRRVIEFLHIPRSLFFHDVALFMLRRRDYLCERTMSFPEKQESVPKDEWVAKLEEGSHMQRVSMNNLIMNYLVTEGFKEAAEKFQQESGVGPTVELSSLDDRIRIRDAIQNGRIQEATDLVNQLHPELLDNDRYLYFHLQQLHLIELIRTGRIEEALQFAQDQLSEAGESDDNILCELERTLALLAFDEPHKSPFSDLLHPTHRQKIASELNAAILKMEHRESTSPRLNNLLKMILWAQDELDKKKVEYPKMTDLGSATIESPKSILAPGTMGD